MMKRQLWWIGLACAALVWTAGCAPERAADTGPKYYVEIEGVSQWERMVLSDMVKVDGVGAQGKQKLAHVNAQWVYDGDNVEVTVKDKKYTLEVHVLSQTRVLLKAK